MLADFWFIQFIGLIALFFAILAFQGKERRQILLRQSFAATLFSIHFWLLSAYSGSVMNLISVFRNIISEKKDRKSWAKSIWWMYLFIGLSLVAVVYFWQGPISLLPALGIIVGTIGVWRNKPGEVRFYMLLTVFIWIPYTIITKSYSGLLTQIIIGTSIVSGMYRLDRSSKVEARQ